MLSLLYSRIRSLFSLSDPYTRARPTDCPTTAGGRPAYRFARLPLADTKPTDCPAAAQSTDSPRCRWPARSRCCSRCSSPDRSRCYLRFGLAHTLSLPLTLRSRCCSRCCSHCARLTLPPRARSPAAASRALSRCRLARALSLPPRARSSAAAHAHAPAATRTTTLPPPNRPRLHLEHLSSGSPRPGRCNQSSIKRSEADWERALEKGN